MRGDILETQEEREDVITSTTPPLPRHKEEILGSSHHNLFQELY